MPRLTQGLTLFTAILWLIGIVVVIQLWLLSATLDALLSGDRRVLVPAAAASFVLFLLNGGLLLFVIINAVLLAAQVFGLPMFAKAGHISLGLQTVDQAEEAHMGKHPGKDSPTKDALRQRARAPALNLCACRLYQLAILHTGGTHIFAGPAVQALIHLPDKAGAGQTEPPLRDRLYEMDAPTRRGRFAQRFQIGWAMRQAQATAHAGRKNSGIRSIPRIGEIIRHRRLISHAIVACVPALVTATLAIQQPPRRSSRYC